MDKERIVKYDKRENVFREKDIMHELNHPNIARLEFLFQDKASLFFVLEYAPNGDLSGLIKKEKKLNIELIRAYAWEIINALEALREIKVVHRDLKPENILLDANWHLKLTDFGDSKKIDVEKVHEKLLKESFLPNVPFNQNYSVDPEFEQNFDIEPQQFEEKQELKRDDSFVGTPLYVSPEMLNHNLAAYATDLWALGWILYQWAWGAPPFNGFTEQQIYDKIINKKIYYPDYLDENLKDLIDELIQVDPKERLGAGVTEDNDLDALKAHPFFLGVDFENVKNQSLPISESSRQSLNMQKKAKNIPFKNDDIDSDLDDCESKKEEAVRKNTGENFEKFPKLNEDVPNRDLKSAAQKRPTRISGLMEPFKNTGETYKTSVVEK